MTIRHITSGNSNYDESNPDPDDEIKTCDDFENCLEPDITALEAQSDWDAIP